MKAQITGFTVLPSRRSGNCCAVFFRGADGKCYRTWTGPGYFNFPRWTEAIDVFRKENEKALDEIKNEVWLFRLKLRWKNRPIINADSKFKLKLKAVSLYALGLKQ